MNHVLRVTDNTYHLLEVMAAERGVTPEQLLNSLVDEAWERECAQYDAAFEHDPGWQETARDAEVGREGHSQVYPSTEAFFQHLGASADEIEAARRLDAAQTANADADAR